MIRYKNVIYIIKKQLKIPYDIHKSGNIYFDNIFIK